MESGRSGEIRVLGRIEIVAVDGACAVPARKERQLLAALLVEAGRTRTNDALIDALWGASPPRSAAKLLHVYVSKLRRVLPPSATVRTDESGYAIELGDDALDAARFERLLSKGAEAACAGNHALAASTLQRSLEIWRGPAYGELAYDDFVHPEAERLEELRLTALEELMVAEIELGRHAEVLAELRLLANAHPLRERLQGLLMLALYRSAKQADALDVYVRTRAVLVEQLGLEPGSELRELQRRVLSHDPSLLAARGPQADLSDTLPAPVNPLLGRARELDELRLLLRRDDVRLVVLTGAGGSGKTRLAIEAARANADTFANGVVLVELALVRDPDLLVPSIADALGIREATGESLDALVTAVQSREVLLVLDNAEHLRPATPHLVELVRRAPHLTVLVTSRVVLHLSGEHVYPVLPLGDEAAIELFRARAREAGTDFEATDAEDDTIRRICDRLDGLPLAIELAAKRARTLSPAELLTRLEARLPLLTGGPHDLPARQQTLRATIEWSFDLLEHARERDLLAAVSVFVGGFTLSAVEQVCDGRLDELVALIDANLVQRVGDRYSMLETIREFAAERLESSGELGAVGRRHAEYFRDFADSLELYPEAIESREVERYDLALAEEANLRAALEWSRTNDPELGLGIAMALEQHWVSHNLVEGKQHFETLLAAQRHELPSDVRARALRCMSGISSLLGDTARARALVEESLALYTELGDEWEIIHLRHRLAICALELGDPGQARELWEGNLDRARARGYRYLEAEALGGLGWVTAHDGDLESAWDLTKEHVEVVQEVRWRWGEVLGRVYLAELSLSLGRFDVCEAEARTALALARELDDRQNTVRTLAVLAAGAGASGDPERAACLWGAIEAEEARGPIGRGESHRAHRELALADRGDELENALAAGRRMSLAEAGAYALAG